MIYLLVNHIAAHPGRDTAHLRLPRPWARDILAAAAAARGAGIRLIVATPVTDAPAPADAVELVPDASGFEHVVLPGYVSARSFLRERSRLDAKLRAIVAAADVVQLDLGGHPIPLGLVADPIARELAKRTLWIIDRSTDLRLGSRSRQVAKRLVGRTLRGSVRRGIAEAIRYANGIVATNDNAAADLRSQHGARVTSIESIDTTDAELPTSSAIAIRHAHLLDMTRPLTIAVRGEQTVDRGLAHVLTAMHRCWRLRAPVRLLASNRGPEAAAMVHRAEELGLSNAVRFDDAVDLQAVALVVDPALSDGIRGSIELEVASGTPVIAYSPRRTVPGVVEITRGSVDALAESLFRAATDRPFVASLLIAGQQWARSVTLDAAHRRRFSLANEIFGKGTTRGAA